MVDQGQYINIGRSRMMAQKDTQQIKDGIKDGGPQTIDQGYTIKDIKSRMVVNGFYIKFRTSRTNATNETDKADKKGTL